MKQNSDIVFTFISLIGQKILGISIIVVSFVLTKCGVFYCQSAQANDVTVFLIGAIVGWYLLKTDKNIFLKE